KTIATMSTGSSRLATIRADVRSFLKLSTGALSFSILLLLNLSCRDLDQPSEPRSSGMSDYFCESDCQGDKFKSSKKNIHIEIEPTGESGHFSSDIDPDTLKSTPLLLNRSVTLTGRADVLDGAATDIIAIPSAHISNHINLRSQL